MSSVSIKQLVVTRGNFAAIANGTFELPEKHLAIVTGANGAGKTSLLQAITGLIPINRGQVSISTNDDLVTSKEFRRLRRYSSYVGHSPLYMRHVSVIEHLELCKKFDYSNQSNGYVLDVEEVIKIFKLENRRNVRVQDLSAGQQKRLHIASSLVRSTEELCIDEPHTSLDADSKNIIDEVIKKQFELGRSFVIATHENDRLLKIATHHIQIVSGQCVLSKVS